jgi:anhydro-N-acetylmuramic acid kinase
MPVVFVNIGGISNITYIGPDGDLLAFDSGPGNALIDQWVARHAGIPYDSGGAIASEGRVLSGLANRYLFVAVLHGEAADLARPQ